MIFTERVCIERQIDGGWTVTAYDVTAAFCPMNFTERIALEPWSHRPLMRFWIDVNSQAMDGDRLIRDDGSAWKIRGVPIHPPEAEHLEGIAEGDADDGLFLSAAVV